MRAAIYARVSTNNGQDPTVQTRELREYCVRRGLEIAGEYVERSLGIEFISLHEGVDTSTPNGRLVFGIFASIAEFERELIRDRVNSGMAAARSKGKRLGRPKVSVDAARIATLRDSGASWSTITRQLGLSAGTAKRAYYNLSKKAFLQRLCSSLIRRGRFSQSCLSRIR
jgi:DNA invertase Pin-like site-specific DNA recombinase